MVPSPPSNSRTALLCAVSGRIHEPRNAFGGERQAPVIENSPVGVGVAGAPMIALKRRASRAARKTVSVRAARETVIRQAVGRNNTCSACSQPVALLGRVGSRTLTQQRPSGARIAPSTSSHDACDGPTVRRDSARSRGVPYTWVGVRSLARHAIAMAG